MRTEGLVLHPWCASCVFSAKILAWLRTRPKSGCAGTLAYQSIHPQETHGVTKPARMPLAGTLQSETRVEVPWREGRQHLQLKPEHDTSFNVPDVTFSVLSTG